MRTTFLKPGYVEPDNPFRLTLFKLLYFSGLLLLCIGPLRGQDSLSKAIHIPSSLIGYWDGAIIKNNAYQKIEVQFYQNDGVLYAAQVMEEWHPNFGEFEVEASMDSSGTVRFNLGYGPAELSLDTNTLEMIGAMTGLVPAIYIHLKKIPEPPAPAYTVEPVEIPSQGVVLSGHLHRPHSNPQKTAIILVGGRGCYASETQTNLYAKFLRQYGVAVLAFQKRGTGNSTGNCATATLDHLATDLREVKHYLEGHPDAYTHIGVLSTSAGAWVMTKAEEQVDFDFMISIVGPATSIRDQQYQSMKYGAEQYTLSEEARKNLADYTQLMYEAKASERDFKRMVQLLENSDEEGWDELLDQSDIPTSASGIDELWVRRHAFDPRIVLSQYKRPFLAIYGDRDWIVPYRENVALLQKYFSGKEDQLTTVIAYGADHGMETQSGKVKLGSLKAYWHFYRVSPEVRIAIVDFLRQHDLIQ